MSDVFQDQLDDLKSRLAAVEKLAENRAAVGPRGPAGPAGLLGQKGERGEAGATGASGKDGRDGITPTKETLESIVAQMLSEYHLLDENGNPYSGPYSVK